MIHIDLENFLWKIYFPWCIYKKIKEIVPPRASGQILSPAAGRVPLRVVIVADLHARRLAQLVVKRLERAPRLGRRAPHLGRRERRRERRARLHLHAGPRSAATRLASTSSSIAARKRLITRRCARSTIAAPSFSRRRASLVSVLMVSMVLVVVMVVIMAVVCFL
jgi:hypothetical protein